MINMIKMIIIIMAMINMMIKMIIIIMAMIRMMMNVAFMDGGCTSAIPLISATRKERRNKGRKSDDDDDDDYQIYIDDDDNEYTHDNYDDHQLRYDMYLYHIPYLWEEDEFPSLPSGKFVKNF